MSPDRVTPGWETRLAERGIRIDRSRHLVSQTTGRAGQEIVTQWRLRLDPGNVGLVEGWPERGLPADAVPAEVPGVWNTRFPDYAGVAWYEAVCDPELLVNGSKRLVIGAANYLTDVWLNGTHLGRHEGGYDTFSFRCTHAVRGGMNRVTLRIVDPPLDGEIEGLSLRTCPTGKESWYGGVGGPWGGVWFDESASIWIDDLRIHADLVGGRVTIRVTLASDLATPTVAHLQGYVGRWQGNREPPHGASATVTVPPAGAITTLTISVPAPEPWSPESPKLHHWNVGVEILGVGYVDSMSGMLGFRTCELRGGRFYLNGEPRFLKGVLRQPTFPRGLLRPPVMMPGDGYPEDRLPISGLDLRLVQTAGVNLVRSHLRPPEPGWLDLTDGLGTMVCVEPPLAWIEPSGRLLEHGKRELAAMVRMCGNHPSVVLWGIFNENARATEAVGSDLMAELATLDPTRPVIENSGGAAVGEVGMWAWGGQSRCWSPGWEAPRPLNDVHIYLANPLRREARDLLMTVGDGPTLDVTPGRPATERIESRMSADAVLVSEFGCGALPDFDAALAAFGDERHLADAVLLRDLRDDLARALAERGLDREIGDVSRLVARTQALQAEGIGAQTAALRRNPNVSGIVLTQLADAGWEQMAGLVGLWRQPRPALGVFRRALRPRLLHVEPDDPCSTGQVRVRCRLIEEPGLPALEGEGTLSLRIEPLTPRPPLPRAGEGETGGVLPSPSQGRGAGGRGAMGMKGPYGRRIEGTSAQPMFAPRSGPWWDVEGHLGTFMLTVPTEPGRYQIRASLTAGDWSDEAAYQVRRLPDPPHAAGEGLVRLGRGLRALLPEAHPSPPPDWRGPILAFLPGRPSRATLTQAVELGRAGAHLCLVGLEPRTVEQLAPLLGLPLRVHGARGNFMGMHHYLREHPLFSGLDAPCLADATFAEVLPTWALDELPGADVLAGCFTVPDGGRAFLWRASVQTLPFGHGRLTVYQLRVGARTGGALGVYLLDRLAGWLVAVRAVG